MKKGIIKGVLLFLITCSKINAQVVINEVMVYPSGNQGMIVFNGNSGNEYIELYNPSCSPIDVSGYFIGDGQDFAGFVSGGGFRIPNVAAAIIPPNGHIVLGTSTSTADANSVDIKLPTYTSNYCQNTVGKNFILANADGWIALYNALGTPIDALYWSASVNNINSNTSDFGPTPCVPGGSPAGVILKSAQQINTSFPGILKYAGPNPSQNQTFSRMPDGGNWQGGVAPSINDLTVGNCNGGNCVTSNSIHITATVTQPSCNGSNGSISIIPSPSGTYNYTWTPSSSTTSSASNLASGTYSVSITSAGGCQKDTTITLNSGNGPTSVITTPVNASCGQTNGSVSIGNVTGGIAPYQYNFNGQGLSSTTSYSSLAAGNYTLVVQDNNGCTYSASNIIISNTNAPTSIVTTPVNASCGQTNGSVSIGNVTGGSAPYQYNFNGQGLSSITSYSNLAAGNYTLVVQDNNGCSYSAPNIIISNTNAPTSIVTTPVNASCGQTNGSVSIGNVTGGSAPYQYNFNGQGLSSATSYSNLGAGNYTLVVQDNNGCTYTAANIIVSNTNAPTSIVTTPVNASCGQTNGSVTIGAVTGGSAPYQYNFNGQGLSSATSYSNLAAGNYTLVVQDNNGCTYTPANIVVNNTNAPTAIVMTPTSSACGQTNGSVALGVVTGGVVPYQYNFNGQGFLSVTNYSSLAAGNYSLVVQDNNGCTYSTSVTITNSPSSFNLVTTIKEPSCVNNDGSIEIITVTGGTSPYTYSFNSSLYTNILSYEGLSSGEYSIIVKDDIGCNNVFSLIVPRSSDEAALFTPNCFTPNSDAINDEWVSKGYCIMEYKCYIFNRWGEKIATLNTIDEKWDGKYKNQDVAEGIYVFIIEAKDANDKIIRRNGHITLLR